MKYVSVCLVQQQKLNQDMSATARSSVCGWRVNVQATLATRTHTSMWQEQYGSADPAAEFVQAYSNPPFTEPRYELCCAMLDVAMPQRQTRLQVLLLSRSDS